MINFLKKKKQTHLSVEKWQQYVSEHMLGMGMKPKLSNEGYEEAAILRTEQDKSVDVSLELFSGTA